MTGSELVAAGERLYGKNWRQPLAARLGVEATTLWRWATGVIPVPGPAALAVELLLKAKEAE